MLERRGKNVREERRRLGGEGRRLVERGGLRSLKLHNTIMIPPLYMARSLDLAGHKYYTCTDCFSAVVPLLRSEGEILEVAITSLGLVNPVAFG